MTEVAIAGVTATGNLGGVAMLESTLSEMSRRIPDIHYSLLSVAPVADRQAKRQVNLNIVAAKPVMLICVYLPLSILFWPLWRRNRFRGIVRWSVYFRTLSQAKLLIDLSGIAFVDGRGPALLLYNLAVFLPALSFGVPVAKLSQSLGPFRSIPNRMLARAALPHCSLLVARGDASLEAVRRIGLVRSVKLPDVTFCLDIDQAQKNAARQKFAARKIRPSPIIISPSEVVRRYLARSDREFAEDIAELVVAIQKAGHEVVLLPHSFGKLGSKNDDLSLCRLIISKLKDRTGVCLIDDVTDPACARALIGEARLFIGSRFHSVVAAFAMGIPTVTIGWSHKYGELAALFGMEHLVLDYSEFTPHRLMELVAQALSKEQEIRERLSNRLYAVRRSSSENFDRAAALISVDQ